MGSRTPKDFCTHEDWLSYVRQEIDLSEQAYALAAGRTQLFQSFYHARNLPFPDEFMAELSRIEVQTEPQRTTEMEHLNHRIFASLTASVFAKAPTSRRGEEPISLSPQEQISELLDHLRKKNPYFALWQVYKNGLATAFNKDDWNDYLMTELGADSPEEVAFSQSMVELDKLLGFFHANGRSLPKLAFERIWFLHHLRGVDRMVQTRAVINLLTAKV